MRTSSFCISSCSASQRPCSSSESARFSSAAFSAMPLASSHTFRRRSRSLFATSEGIFCTSFRVFAFCTSTGSVRTRGGYGLQRACYLRVTAVLLLVSPGIVHVRLQREQGLGAGHDRLLRRLQPLGGLGTPAVDIAVALEELHRAALVQPAPDFLHVGLHPVREGLDRAVQRAGARGRIRV